MAGHSITSADRRRAEDRVEIFARSIYVLRGLPLPASDTMGSIIGQALGGIGPDELRHPDSLSQATIGRIGQLVSNMSETGVPRSLYGAEAARAQQAAGVGMVGGLGGLSRWAALQGGAADADARDGDSGETRGSSRRFKEITRERDDRARVEQAAQGTSAATFMNQYGLDRGTATMFQNYGMTGAAYGGLVHQGYGAEQIKQATQFAGDLDVNAGKYAKDLIRVKTEDREKVKTFVSEVRDDPSLTPEQKQTKVQEFRKANPEVAKALDDKALTGIINGKRKKEAERDAKAARELGDGKILEPSTKSQSSLSRTSKRDAIKVAKLSEDAQVGKASSLLDEAPATEPKGKAPESAPRADKSTPAPSTSAEPRRVAAKPVGSTPS